MFDKKRGGRSRASAALAATAWMAPALLLFGLLSGCAGRPAVPPADYAKSSIHGALRIAIDQDGNLYPRSAEQFNWEQYASSVAEPLVGTGFRLASIRKDGQPLYTPAVQQQALDSVAGELNRRLDGKTLLIVFIHGFNNGFLDGADSFKQMHDYVHDSARANAVFVEVFWDGFQARVLPGNPSSSYWQRSLDYSELAGRRGLRDVLNRVTRDVDVRIVTHSRGAAVALSMLTCQAEANCATPLLNKRLKSVKLAAFAPAIGARHLQVPDLPSTPPVDVLIGFNSKDIASGKYFLPTFSADATNLGSDRDAIATALAAPRGQVRLRAFEFTHGTEHGLEHYFGNAPELTRCMFSLAGLRPAGAQACANEMTGRRN